MSRCYAKILKSEGRNIWMKVESEELGQENMDNTIKYKIGMAVGYSNDGSLQYLDSFQKSFSDSSRISGSYFTIKTMEG